MIKLHHLRFSRSTRIIWLLEELGLQYEMEEHHRNPETNRSQEDLFAIHPLGKAPTVEIDGHVMVESGAIIEYIIETRGEGQLAPASNADRATYLEWLQFAEGTLAMPILLTLLGPRFGGLGDILGGFVGGEVTKLLDYIDGHMEGREFLVGDALTGADINLEYLLELSNMVGLLDERPQAKAYLERLMDRPAYKKAIEIGGPLVNREG
ncbi:glutathione S-transferase family protein [Parasphingopyxis algicola]|uniref:glutathione S-transferase family protein n=1 Tax=Parasphingopyxis algicola TaxID=2026624 RepID=UPI0015A3004D|nr:glutathione S-transferase family protein [Parasphingopyxis algicola]QLC24693.1 glutathione S-transferase family protein [Parasphingopyxis algicola]